MSGRLCIIWEFCFLGSWNGILAIIVYSFRYMYHHHAQEERGGRERGVAGISIDIEELVVNGRGRYCEILV